MIAEAIKIIDEIDTPVFKVKLRDDGIVVFEANEKEEMTEEDIVAANNAAGKLTNGLPAANLVVFEKFIQTTPEARAYAACEESNRYTIADAFVVKSDALKIVGNFYLRFNKPVRPTKIFTDEFLAVEWLYSILNKNNGSGRVA